MSLIPNNVWFGTENDMRWVPAPLPNYTPAQVRWRAKDQYLNGGAGVRQSTASHKELSLSWPVQSQEDLAPLVSYLQQAGPYFYLDPLNAEANAVPAYWSMPGLVQDGPPLIPGVAPSYVPTVGGRTLGYPTTSAVYEVEGTPNPNDTIRNYVTNPEFKTTSGTVEIFRNLWFPSKPSINGNGQGITSSFATHKATSEGREIEVTSAFPNSAVSLIYTLTPSKVPVVAGQPYSYRFGFKNTGDIPFPLRIILWMDQNLVEPSRSAFTWIQPGETYYFEGDNYIATEGAKDLRYSLYYDANYANKPPVGSKITVLDGACITNTEKKVTAFSPQDSDLEFSFTGTTNASESILSGQRVTGVNPTNNGVLIRSSKLGGSGRFISMTDTANNYQNLYGPFPVSTGLREGGRSKIVATFLDPVDQAFPGLLPTFWVQAPNILDTFTFDVGSKDLEIIWGPRTSSYTVLIRPNIKYGQSCYLSKFGVFPPDYTGPWFDGDSEPFLYNGKVYVPSWAGTPHNSQSVATAYEGNANTRIRIPVPEGYTLHVGLHGSGPGIAVGGVTAPAIPLTSTERTNLQYSTPGIATIQLLPGTHVISGIIAQVLPTGAEVPRGGFIPGMGHSQLVLDGDPTVTHYSVGIANAQTGIAADFVEVGAWL